MAGKQLVPNAPFTVGVAVELPTQSLRRLEALTSAGVPSDQRARTPSLLANLADETLQQGRNQSWLLATSHHPTSPSNEPSGLRGRKSFVMQCNCGQVEGRGVVFVGGGPLDSAPPAPLQVRSLLKVVPSEVDVYSPAHVFPTHAYDLLKLNIRAYLSSIMMLVYPLQVRVGMVVVVVVAGVGGGGG